MGGLPFVGPGLARAGGRWCRSPTFGEGGAFGGGGEDALATFPVDSFDSLVLDVEWVLFGHGGDDLLGAFDLAKGHVNPYVLQNIGDLAEQGKDFVQARGQELVDAVFDGVEVPHVVNEDDVAQLADALNAAFALFQARWIPGQVQVYEGGQALEVEALGCGVGAKQQANLSKPDLLFDVLAPGRGEAAVLPDGGLAGAGVDRDAFAGQVLNELVGQPVNGIVELAEDDAALFEPAFFWSGSRERQRTWGRAPGWLRGL